MRRATRAPACHPTALPICPAMKNCSVAESEKLWIANELYVPGCGIPCQGTWTPLDSTPRKLRCRGFGGLIAPVRASIPIRVRRALRMAVEVESIAENYMQGWGDASPVGPIGNAVREAAGRGRLSTRGRRHPVQHHLSALRVLRPRLLPDRHGLSQASLRRSSTIRSVGPAMPCCVHAATAMPAHCARCCAGGGSRSERHQAVCVQPPAVARAPYNRFSPQPPTAAEMRQDQVPVSPHDATA